jgi:hypothetical protein
MAARSVTSRYTNEDIMQTLMAMRADQGRLEEKVDDVTVLAQKTNGRVTKLEQRQFEQDAVDNYKKDQPVIQHAESVVVQQEQRWYNNATLVMAVVAFLLAVAGYLGYIAGGPQ